MNTYKKMNAELKSTQGVTWEIYDARDGKRVNILLMKGDAGSPDWWASYPLKQAGRPAKNFRITPDRVLQDWFAACDAAGVQPCVAHSYSANALQSPVDFIIPWKSSPRDWERVQPHHASADEMLARGKAALEFLSAEWDCPIAFNGPGEGLTVKNGTGTRQASVSIQGLTMTLTIEICAEAVFGRDDMRASLRPVARQNFCWDGTQFIPAETGNESRWTHPGNCQRTEKPLFGPHEADEMCSLIRRLARVEPQASRVVALWENFQRAAWLAFDARCARASALAMTKQGGCR